MPLTIASNLVTRHNSVLLRLGDGTIAGDVLTRMGLMQSTDEGHSWSWVSTIGGDRSTDRKIASPTDLHMRVYGGSMPKLAGDVKPSGYDSDALALASKELVFRRGVALTRQYRRD